MKTSHRIIAFFTLIFLLTPMISYGYSSNKTEVQNSNEIVEVENPSDLLVLVNKDNYLSKDYVPKDLRPVALPSATGKNQLRGIAASALEAMFKAAEKNGHILFTRSGYRSYNTQSQIFYGYVKKYGRTKTETFSAPPGMSEHQTGLVMDICSKGTNYTLNAKFGELPEGKWVKENSWRYGFIVRYPKDKTDVTRYTYEPWHLRYVGLDAAKKMHKNELVLEEYLDSIKWKEDAFA